MYFLFSNLSTTVDYHCTGVHTHTVACSHARGIYTVYQRGSGQTFIVKQCRHNFKKGWAVESPEMPGSRKLFQFQNTEVYSFQMSTITAIVKIIFNYLLDSWVNLVL